MPPTHSLRPFQAQALQSLARPNADLICIAPTGSGKGWIVEKIAQNPKERVLLISPLIALGRQQHLRFISKKIPTHCSMGNESSREITRSALQRARVWILSPESATNLLTTQMVMDWKPTLIVVDECHCIYEWGEEFRPAYGQIPQWIKKANWRRTLWMSATLPRRAQKLIETGLGRELEIQGKFELPAHLEIRFLKTPWSHRLGLLNRILREKPQGGIIFTGSREMTERIHRLVASSGRETYFYHAGLSSEERRLTETKIDATRSAIVIATSAFGMGMDYEHLRWVLLWQPPRTLLSLAQALGRVGRNQREGQALLFWDEEDLHRLAPDACEFLKKDAPEHSRKNFEKYFH